MSTKQEPRENSLFKLSKEYTSFKWLLVFIMELLILKHYFRVKWDVAI